MTTGGEGKAPSPVGAGPVLDTEQALAELDAIRRRVVNVVGHVLRTPTTTIAGMASALQRADDDETRQRLVLGLARNAQRLEDLLDDLLVAAGVNTALPVGDPEPIPIAAALRRAWASVGGVGVLAIDGPALVASARAESFDRIATILLDNAVKYGDGTVTIRNEPTSTGLCIEIESGGEGPNDDELSHAFELLYRGEHAVMAAPGLGLGLAVARALARSEGGDVRLARAGDAVVASVDLPT